MENKALKNASNGFGDKWGTPPDLWMEIRKEIFRDDTTRVYDPCPGRHPLPVTTTESGDGLFTDWGAYSQVFVNPPFSDIWPWAEKAALHGGEGTTVVMLVPNRSDQPWWEAFAPFATITFIRGRVQYIDHRTGSVGKAPAFPSVILTFGKRPGANQHWWPVCHQERMKRHIAQTKMGYQGVFA